jgi:site-specific DNA-methyltransferase (adenine-specific)
VGRDAGAEMSVTLLQGDCLGILPTLEDMSVDAIITDPPYSSGGQFRGDRNGVAGAKYQTTETVKEYPDFHGDNRDQRSYFYWCALWLGQCLRIIKPGGLLMVFTDWRQLPVICDAVQIGGWVWRGIVPWNKTEAARPTKGRFRAQCEYVVWATAGPMNEQVEMCMPGFFTYGVKPNEKLHVTAKPESLMFDMLSITRDGATILDPFMGSGTTGKACVLSGRNFIGIEKSKEYFEVSQNRIKEAQSQMVMELV